MTFFKPGILLILVLASCQTGGPGSFTGAVLPELKLDAGELHVAFLGDTGEGDDAQLSVAKALIAAHQARPFSFIGLLGDNFYPKGVSSTEDAQFKTAFEIPYPAAQLPVPFYVVMGNHDHRGSLDAQYTYSDGRWFSREGAYLVPVVLSGGKRIDFYFVDSEMLQPRQPKAAAIVGWIKATVSRRPDAYRVLICHRPLYSSGMHGDTHYLDRDFAWALGKGTFSAYLSGHDHDLELQVRDPDGDGRSEVFAVSGAGSETRPITVGPRSLFAQPVLGFLELTVSSSGTRFQFIDTDGKTAADYLQKR